MIPSVEKPVACEGKEMRNAHSVADDWITNPTSGEHREEAA
jgi:hypothetical protein